MNAMSKYVIIKKKNFDINYGYLVDLYAPILGAKSFNIYLWIINEFNKQQRTENLPHFIKNLLSFHNISMKEFTDIRKQFEALNLIKTFVVEENNIYTCFFEMQQPLNFNNFIANNKFRKLLISKISLENFEQLNFTYQDSYINSKASNVSASFEMVYDCNEITRIKCFDFDKLQDSLKTLINKDIKIETGNRYIIDNFCENYNLSYETIETIVMNCICADNDQMSIDEDILRLKLQQLIKSYEDVSNIEHLQIFRNRKLFTQDLDEEQTKQIFECYRLLNSEQYLSAIVKRKLITPELGAITLLRDEYKLEDSVINLIIDCSLFQTQGHVRPKYMIKMADNFNMLGLKELLPMIGHIRVLLTPENKFKKNKRFPINRQTTEIFQHPISKCNSLKNLQEDNNSRLDTSNESKEVDMSDWVYFNPDDTD